MSLAARLLSLVALAVSPALAVVAYNEINLRHLEEVHNRELVVQTSERAAAELRQIIDNARQFSAIVAKLPEVMIATAGSELSEDCSTLLTSLRRDSPGQLEFGIANGEGVIVCTTQGAQAARPVEGAHFRQALNTNEFAIGTFGVKSNDGCPVSHVCATRPRR